MQGKDFYYNEPEQEQYIQTAEPEQMVEEQVIVVQPAFLPEQTSGVVLVESVTAIIIAFIGYKTARLMMDHKKK